ESYEEVVSALGMAACTYPFPEIYDHLPSDQRERLLWTHGWLLEKRRCGDARQARIRADRFRDNAVTLQANRVCHEPTGLELIEEGEEFSIVEEEITRLEPWEAQIVNMRICEEHSFRFIGKVLGVAPPTAQRRFTVAFEKLRIAVHRRLGFA
ncbi:MAG: hypothetical protein KF841_13890, partial [Phycisphaerae bacterium]|nr:hypothetical protein [Phycisphaerae bacterium]